MKRSAFCAVLAASMVMSAGAVRAEDAMRIQLADLNLQTDQGATVALARIQHQADAFCSAGEGRQALAVVAAVNKCVVAMSRKAVDQLGAPRVTTLYAEAGRTPDARPVALARR